MATTSAIHAPSGLNTAIVPNLSISPNTNIVYQRYTSNVVGIFDFLNLACSPLISRSYAFKPHHDHNLCHTQQYPNGLCPSCQADLNALATLPYGTQIFGGFSSSISWMILILTLNYPHPFVFPSGKASPRSSTNQMPPPSSPQPRARIRN